MLRHLLAATVAVLGLTAPASAQLYFRDNFNTNSNPLAGRVPSGPIGGVWSEVSPGASTALTSGGVLLIDNNTDNNSNAFGAAAIGNSFASTTLTNLPRWVEWRFNMQINTSPTGFANQPGIAVVLAATSTNLDSGSGYAVAFGRNGSLFELVSYGAGLTGTLTPFAASSSAPLSSNTNFASVRVTYNPVTDNWQLFVRDDGATPSVDPYSGTIPAVTGLVLNTTLTSTAGMGNVGAYLSYDTVDDRIATFDNFTIAAVPEPTTWALIGLSAAGLIGGVYRYRRGAAKTLNTEVDVEANEVA